MWLVQQFILYKTHTINKKETEIEQNLEKIWTFIQCKLPLHTHTYLICGLLKHYQNSLGIYFLLNVSYFPILKNKYLNILFRNDEYFRERVLLELSSGIDRDHQLSPILVRVDLIEKREPRCPYPQLSPFILIRGVGFRRIYTIYGYGYDFQ